ncbi:MAG: XdhC family protein [Chloroflexi bacterium]|nr:XdhC family protein [Chloroflexota bacterium]MBP8059122.1 XdhC family protein [Chloroflexota bacterium]
MIDDFFAKAHELVLAGVPFVTATVVRAEKPTSGKPGDKAIITVDGVMHGWIGGSCAQPTVIKEALKALAADEAKLIRLSTEPEGQKPRDGLVDLPMTCFSGGTLEIYLEPQAPRPRLLIVGTLPVARALAHLGSAMNYHVTLVDLDGGTVGRPATADGGGTVGQNAIPYVNETLTSLDNIASKITPTTYIVVASHGNYDELALEKLLAANPGYVGLVASRKRAEGVRDYLLDQGLTDTDLLPLKAPAGLDIQARRGDEIALSIMAEIVQRRRNAEEVNLALYQERIGSEQSTVDSEQLGVNSEQSLVSSPQSLSPSVSQSPLPTISLGQISIGPVVLPVRGAAAIDPICQMEVEMSTAKYTHEHNGTMYYFCCAGCQRTFAKEPEKYL